MDNRNKNKKIEWREDIKRSDPQGMENEKLDLRIPERIFCANKVGIPVIFVKKKAKQTTKTIFSTMNCVAGRKNVQRFA